MARFQYQKSAEAFLIGGIDRDQPLHRQDGALAVAGGVELFGKVGEHAGGNRIQAMALSDDPLVEAFDADREIV